MEEKKCARCGLPYSTGTRYCGGCGAPLADAMFPCPDPVCKHPNPGSAKFCGGCGKPLRDRTLVLNDERTLALNEWRRQPDEFAARIEVEDVDGLFKKGLIVEAGTKALFFTNGAYSGLVDAGKHEMGGLLHRINNVFSSKRATALLVDAADVELSFTLSNVQTRDPVRLTTDCRIVLRLDDPTGFFENLMKSRASYPLPELKSFLFEELQNAVQEFVGAQTVNDLSSNLAVKRKLEETATAHMATTLERKGLTLVQVRVLNFRHERLDAATRAREEYWLSADEMNVKLQGHQQTVGLTRRLLDAETEKALVEVEAHEQRLGVFRRLQEAKWESAEQLERTGREYDKKRLIREDEWAELKRTYEERQGDHALARAHTLQLLTINQNAEQARAALLLAQAQRGLTDAQRSEGQAQLEHQLTTARSEAVRKLSDEWARFALDRDKRRGEREDDDEEARRALERLRQLKEIKAAEADRELDRKLKEQQATAEVFAKLTPETLIAMADEKKAPILAELRRTELLRGATEEQILAMAAANNPDVAKAITEKYHGASAASEQMLKMQREHAAQMQLAANRNADRLQEMFNRGMDTQRDTAVAAARAGQPAATTIVTPGVGQPGMMIVGSASAGQTSGGTHVVVCQNCHADAAAGSRFCENCGHKFFE